MYHNIWFLKNCCHTLGLVGKILILYWKTCEITWTDFRNLLISLNRHRHNLKGVQKCLPYHMFVSNLNLTVQQAGEAKILHQQYKSKNVRFANFCIGRQLFVMTETAQWITPLHSDFDFDIRTPFWKSYSRIPSGKNNVF